MLQKLDLAAIAESIATPYRPVPLVSFGAIEASLVVCGGSKKWQRSAQRDELLIVLEGHVTIQGNTQRVIANEGDVANIPSSITMAWWSGMRSIAVLCQERDRPFNANGYHGAPTTDRELASRTEFAARVRSNAAYDWLRLGRVGGYVASAARLTGPSQPFVSPPGSLLVLVFRGILDVGAESVDSADGADGAEPDTIVGSQLLVVPAGRRIRMASERGATVLVIARQGAPLPRAAIRADAMPPDAVDAASAVDAVDASSGVDAIDAVDKTDAADTPDAAESRDNIDTPDDGNAPAEPDDRSGPG
ncbi:MAG: hypothetical protein IT332_09295 [Ardenticatenales bacterium]|nr:hypothetical protein [Ardenticatenales bacterium]